MVTNKYQIHQALDQINLMIIGLESLRNNLGLNFEADGDLTVEIIEAREALHRLGILLEHKL